MNYSELYHHGIKGQKWGVRRFENEDGTLTPAGKARYGQYNDNESDAATVQKVGILKGAKMASDMEKNDSKAVAVKRKQLSDEYKSKKISKDEYISKSKEIDKEYKDQVSKTKEAQKNIYGKVSKGAIAAQAALTSAAIIGSSALAGLSMLKTGKKKDAMVAASLAVLALGSISATLFTAGADMRNRSKEE